MRLVCWNVAARVKKCPAQMAAVASRTPDLVALQEVTKGNITLLRNHLQGMGLPYILDTAPAAMAANRRYAVLVASRWPLTPIDHGFTLPWPERVLSATVNHPERSFDLHATYIPTGASKAGSEFKMATLEGLYQGLAHHSPQPRILCGDFNTPQAETVDGQLITFGQNIRANGETAIKRSLYGQTGQRWDQAERAVLEGLAEFDLADVFRKVNGYQPQDSSWYAKNRGRLFGFRLDHVFASATLGAKRCAYLHPFREDGLSDHAPLEVDFGRSIEICTLPSPFDSPPTSA